MLIADTSILDELDLQIQESYSHLAIISFLRSVYPTLPCSLINDVNSQFTTLITKAPNSADQNP